MATETKDINYEYINKESIDKRLICPICSEPLTNPVETNCQPKPHTFCRNCIETWVQTDPSCPSCHQKLNIQDLMPISTVNFVDMLDEILGKCLACQQTGLKRMDFDAHYNEKCPKANVQCPLSDFMCPWRGTRDQLEEHLKACIITLIKPDLLAVQSYYEESQDIVDKQETQIERLMNEITRLTDRVNRQRMPIIGPLKANQTLNVKVNHRQTQVAEPLKVDRRQHDKKIFLQQLQQLISKLIQGQTQTEAIANDNKELTDKLNQLQTENTILQYEKQELEQQLKKQTDTVQMLLECVDQPDYSPNYDDQTATGINDSINNTTYRPISNAVHNRSPPPGYYSLGSSDNGSPIGGNPLYTPRRNNVTSNPSGNITENTLNRSGIEPYIIPIFIPISVNTNIAGGNNSNNAGRANNNIAGGSNNNICGGNTNAGGGNSNNSAGGSYNNIASGNNNAGRMHNLAAINNPTDINNAIGGNNIAGSIGNSGGISNTGGITNSNGINNTAGINHISGGNHITGGNDNNITGCNYNAGGNSNNSAGGRNNSIAGGDNSLVENHNHNGQNGLNNTINDDNTENDTNDSVTEPFDDLRRDTSSDTHRIRANPDIVHPPDNDNW